MFYGMKFSIGQYGYIALATDTEGNMIGLHSMKCRPQDGLNRLG